MFDVKKRLAVIAFGSLLVGLAGCAGTEQTSSLESRVATLEQQQSATMNRIDKLEAQSAQTMRAAEAAQQSARDAAETSRRIEDMFKKSMRK